MEKLLKNKMLMLLVAVVVLYVVYKKFWKEGVEEEPKAGAGGLMSLMGAREEDEPCVCEGQFIGNMSPRKCRKMCRKAHHFNF